MIKNNYIALCLILFFTSCDTYQTFYKPTHKTVATEKEKADYRIDLSDQNTSDIITKITCVTDVRSLNLSGITTVAMDSLLAAIPNPEQLKVLILDRTNLVLLPTSIKRFKNLKQLSLNANSSIDLQQCLERISSLPIEFLNLQNNNLTSIPQNITALSKLEDLNLSNNTLSDAKTYNYLSQLPKLRSLWLTNNQFKKLPPTIVNLSRLKKLYLENNLLETLPEDLSTLTSLQVLHIGHNDFKTLPESLITVPALLLLHINNCNITKISEAFTSKNISFKGIILDQNPLSDSEKKRWKKEFSNFFLVSMN